MYKLLIPDDSDMVVSITDAQGKTSTQLAKMPFRVYIQKIIMTLPYWRTAEGSAFYDDLVALSTSDTSEAMISDAFREKLSQQMELPGVPMGSMDPEFARTAVKFARSVHRSEMVSAAERY